MTEGGNKQRNTSNKKRRPYNKRRANNQNPQRKATPAPEKNGNTIAPTAEDFSGNGNGNTNDGQSQLLPNTVTVTANDYTQACQEAMMKLNIHDDALLGHEIVEKGKRNFLGILGSRDITYKFFIVPKADIMTQSFLDNVVKLSLLDVTFHVHQADNVLEVDFEGPDSELLKDRGYELITSIEQLTRKFLIKKAGIKSNFKIKFSVEGETNSKELRLENLAQRMKEKVVSKEKSIVLRSMSPRDRRIIHQCLGEDELVGTKSLGNGHYKRIKIFLRNETTQNTKNEEVNSESQNVDENNSSQSDE